MIYRQTRIGRDGRCFRCLKFRTMAVNAPGHAREPLVSQDDPGLTAAGRFLRSTSVDELPRLLKVLRGGMSLVGPRPIAASDEPLFGDQIAAYRAMKPAVTGLWQISGRSKLSYSQRVPIMGRGAAQLSSRSGWAGGAMRPTSCSARSWRLRLTAARGPLRSGP